MNTQEIQQWLKDMGYYKGNIDGVVGDGTRAALRKAQQYLSSIGLYHKIIDGKIGEGTINAITNYKKGNSWISGVAFNRFDKNSIQKAVNQLRAKGIGEFKDRSGNMLNLNSNDIVSKLYQGVAGVQTFVNKSTSELQTWLKNHGFDPGKIDGIMGDKTKAAIKSAQQYLGDLGLFDGSINGKVSEAFSSAIAKFDSGAKKFRSANVSYNENDPNSVVSAINKLKAAGHKAVTINGTVYKIDDPSLAGIMYTGSSKNKDDNAGMSITKALGSTTPGQDSGESSYGRVSNNLDKLWLGYVYDKYHGNAVDDKEWGISFNYNPHNTFRNTISGIAASFGYDNSIDLKIDANKYKDLSQAQQIARGAGVQHFYWNGKKYETNLFDIGEGSKYKDRADFEQAVNDAKNSGDLAKAQNLWEDERERQYNQFGISFNQLKDKNAQALNTLFGVVPAGYNVESMSAIAKGQQAVDPGNTSKGSMTTMASGYRDRFKYNNFDQWYQGFILANEAYQGKYKITPNRLANFQYSIGLPLLDNNMREELTVRRANPDATDIDTKGYMNSRGHTDRMHPYIFARMAASNNIGAVHDYLQYMFDPGGKGKVTRKKDQFTDVDLAELDKLADAAKLPRYHRGEGKYDTAAGRELGKFIEKNPYENTLAGKLIGPSSHDMYESLQSIYENAFERSDDGGWKYKQRFTYGEPGYNYSLNGGAYSVVINTSDPNQFKYSANDAWNFEIPGLNLNAGVTANKGQGVPSVNQGTFKPGTLFKGKIGGILKYIM